MGTARSGREWKRCSNSSCRTSMAKISTLSLSWVSQAFIPELPRSMMQPCPDLANNFMRKISGGAGRVDREDAVSDAVEEGAGEHVTCSGEILRFGGERWNVGV